MRAPRIIATSIARKPRGAWARRSGSTRACTSSPRPSRPIAGGRSTRQASGSGSCRTACRWTQPMATASGHTRASAGSRSACGCFRRPGFPERTAAMHPHLDLAGIIDAYGYWAVAIGSFLEGETVLALAGLAAYRGYLDFYLVCVVAGLCGFLGDQLYFFLGRFRGNRMLARFPNAQVRARKFDELLARYHAP